MLVVVSVFLSEEIVRQSKATEVQRVAQEVAVIRTALKNHGYQIRKRSRQVAWKVYLTPDNYYVLTYQPAPSSSWVLHPQNNDLERQHLESIIQTSLTKS